MNSKGPGCFSTFNFVFMKQSKAYLLLELFSLLFYSIFHLCNTSFYFALQHKSCLISSHPLESLSGKRFYKFLSFFFFSYFKVKELKWHTNNKFNVICLNMNQSHVAHLHFTFMQKAYAIFKQLRTWQSYLLAVDSVNSCKCIQVCSRKEPWKPPEHILAKVFFFFH